MKQQSPKIVFMGTPEFGALILEGLLKNNYWPELVITSPDKPSGRKQVITPPPVKIMAQRYGLRVIQPKRIKEAKEEIESIEPDLIIVAAYSQIIPQEVLDIPKRGALCVHPSLLPKHRGPSPIQSAILKGEKETGVTVILMDAKIDHGPIVAQKKTIIGPNETGSQLHERLGYLGAELLIDTIPDWLAGNIQLRRQDEKRASYTKIIKKEDGLIDWKKSAKEIERQIRAFDPWPGAYTFWQKKIVKIKNLKKPVKEKEKRRLKIIKARLDKDKLVIEKVQPEGKKIMNFEDFLRGNPDFLESNKLIRKRVQC